MKKSHRQIFFTVILASCGAGLWATEENEFEPCIHPDMALESSVAIDSQGHFSRGEDTVYIRNEALNSFSAPSFQQPEEYDGIAVQWNYSGYESSRSADDWGYFGYSLVNRFHPDESELRNGYVYMHAVLTNTNTFSVSLDISAPKIDVSFNIKQLSWQPSEKGICNLVQTGESTKDKLIYPDYPPKTFSSFFLFSLTDNKIGVEIRREAGVIRIDPGQTVLVKWYAKEKVVSEYMRLLPKGVLPKVAGCVPQRLVPEFYDQCDNGKLDQCFLPLCKETQNSKGQLVFTYHVVSQMEVFLKEATLLWVGQVGQKLMERKFYTDGMKTREFKTSEQ